MARAKRLPRLNPKTQTSKTLYKGSFNYHGKVYLMYKHAISIHAAFPLFINQVVKDFRKERPDLRVSAEVVYEYFEGTDYYTISIEKEG